MSIYDSKQWREDIREVLAHCPEISELAGKTVFVSGASGLICSAVVDLFIGYNERHAEKINILAAGRSAEKMRARFAPYFDAPYFSFVLYDATANDNTLDVPCDYIIHGAGNAYPGAFMKEPVETMVANFDGTKRLLDYARACGAKRFLYISSSEVYGQKEGDQPYREEDYGYIDILNPRSAYAMGKRAAETLCISYAAEYGVDTVIARPGHIYGPTASPEDNRVSSAWAYAAARGEDIVMMSDGRQVRSYCYCLDCASAILKVMLHGEKQTAYNISPPDSILSIREMASLLAKVGSVKLTCELTDEAANRAFNPMHNSSLDNLRLMMLGWKGYFSAERGINHTVSILQD